MKITGFLLLMLLSVSVMGQREIEEDAGWTLKDRLYFGGGFGLSGGQDSYGNKYFYFALNPIVGYMVTPDFSVGTGVGWQRLSYSEPVKQKIDQYAVSPFARYNFGQLFAYGEYSLVNSSTFISTERRNFDRLLLGLGYSQSTGQRGAINVMALYDVLYREDEAFASPWVFRVFFSF